MNTIFKTTIRNFARKPITNLINLLGLSISLTLVIILSVYCYSELSTDGYHTHANRVYLYSDVNNLPRIYTPGILKENIDMNIPEVESSVRLAGTWRPTVFQSDGKEPMNSELLFADQEFFKLFTYKAVEGNPITALAEPLSLVISKKMSLKLFGEGSSVGKTIKINNGQVLTVKAVVDEPEGNSCLSFSAVTSVDTRKILMPNDTEFKVWDMCFYQTFVLLKTGVNPQTVANRIASFFPKEMQKAQSAASLTPLRKIYFSNFALFNGNYLRFGDKNKVIILLIVAVLVLLIALVNFINISTAHWFENISQTGVMKVFGGSGSSILRNILSNAFIFFLGALVIAVFLASYLAPAVSDYTGIYFKSKLIYAPSTLMISIGATFFLSIVFSFIPALRISSSRVVDNLKNSAEPGQLGSMFRGVLVVAQFAIAMILIAFTILVQKQVYFGSNLGIKKDNVIGIKLTPELEAKKEVLKKLLADNPAVLKTSFAQFFPGELVSHWSTQVDENGEKKPIEYDSFTADGEFPVTLGLKLVAGRFYSDKLSTDANKAIVNETFVKQNKLLNPIGLKFSFMNGNVYEIVGVVKDFHYKPVNQPVAPLAILNDPFASYCLFSLKTLDYNSLNKQVGDITTAVAGLSSAFPVEVSFLDQAVENMYRSEIQFRRVFFLFSGSAIVICCLGILAISLFVSSQRTKEIGIRRVNGACVAEVMAMLNRDFTKWVAIAFVIACPVAWFIMHKWLEDYAYKTAMSWWIFVLAGGIAVLIALITVSWQSWRAATRNPVESLRYE